MSWSQGLGLIGRVQSRPGWHDKRLGCLPMGDETLCGALLASGAASAERGLWALTAGQAEAMLGALECAPRCCCVITRLLASAAWSCSQA